MSTDVYSPEKRSAVMRRVKGRDTAPEMTVRRLLRRARIGYRLGGCRLPGRPDVVMKGRRVVLFVHGCFWHGHDCPLFRWPKAREAFWREKIGRNRERDGEVVAKLGLAGWRVLTIWECSIRGPGRIGADAVLPRAADWLGSTKGAGEIRGTVRAGG